MSQAKNEALGEPGAGSTGGRRTTHATIHSGDRIGFASKVRKTTGFMPVEVYFYLTRGQRELSGYHRLHVGGSSFQLSFAGILNLHRHEVGGIKQ
jgi:hypothetical protein